MNFNKFTQRSIDAVSYAQQMAQADEHPQITPEHLLAALLKQEEGLVAQVVKKLGVDLEGVTEEVENDLWLIVALDALVILVGFLFHKQIVAVCFDEEYALVRGVNVQFFYLLLLCLTALTVVILTTVVGIVMVIAFLTLPVAVAGFFTRKIWQTIVLATLLSIGFMTFGLAISYGPDLPAGATIIILAGVTYLVAAVIVSIRKLKSS